MKIKIILLLVLFYIAALIITLPAQRVLPFIPEHTGLKVGAVSGSLWNGHAAQLTYKKQFKLQRVNWKVDWSGLASLQLKLHVEFDNGMQAMSGKGFILLGFSGVSVENFVVDSSAKELVTYAALSVPAEINGDISLVIKSATQGSPYCQQLDGFIVWQNASISSEIGDLDLDSAHIDLRCDKGQIAGDGQQDSDQLTTSATFLLKDKGIYQLQGTLKPGENIDPAIKSLFSWLGGPNKSGENTFNFNGRL